MEKHTTFAAHCKKFDEPVRITESYNADAQNRIKFANPLRCSNQNCNIKDCNAAGWATEPKRQYWEKL